LIYQKRLFHDKIRLLTIPFCNIFPIEAAPSIGIVANAAALRTTEVSDSTQLTDLELVDS